mmetsp:Transcript_44693/g.107813  ORF Transcript_44693/g.107813 Transcript_44693/m.107813 type:complete len:157 (+) Transcript_44693:44-514(+)
MSSYNHEMKQNVCFQVRPTDTGFNLSEARDRALLGFEGASKVALFAVEPRRLMPPIGFFRLSPSFLRRAGSDLLDFIELIELKLCLEEGRRMEAMELILSLEVGRRIFLEPTDCTDAASDPFLKEDGRGVLRLCSELASKLRPDAGFLGTLLEETD